ncbi:MAG TPA: hypothetical protein VFC07_00005, partial [Verrucomicrobiae bacterium]|nr:hypothetical protein [Verrucomicrobiae bacterium]
TAIPFPAPEIMTRGFSGDSRFAGGGVYLLQNFLKRKAGCGVSIDGTNRVTLTRAALSAARS